MSKEDIIVGTISASLSSLALGLFYLVLKSPQKPQQPRQNVDKNTLYRLLKQRKVQAVDKIGKLREECKQQRLQYFLKDPAKYHSCINNLGEQVVSVMNTNVSELQNQNNLKLDDFNLALLINILQPDIKLLKSLKFYQTSVKESSLPSKQISQEKAIEMLNVKCTTSRDLLNAVGQVNDQQTKTQIAYFFVWDELERRFPEYTYGQMEYTFVKHITDNPGKYRLFVEWMQNLDNMMTGKKQKVTKSLILDIIFDTKKQIKEDARNLSDICSQKRKLYFKKNDEKYIEIINEFNQNITALINGKIYEVALSYGVEPQELDGVISQFLNDPETIRAMNELYSGNE